VGLELALIHLVRGHTTKVCKLAHEALEIFGAQEAAGEGPGPARRSVPAWPAFAWWLEREVVVPLLAAEVWATEAHGS